jgi:hypothetical protein
LEWKSIQKSHRVPQKPLDNRLIGGRDHFGMRFAPASHDPAAQLVVSPGPVEQFLM